MNTAAALPPSNESSEQGLLGCCIYDQQNVSRAFDAGIRPEAFFNSPHRDLWHALRTMDAAGDTVDPITLRQHLQNINALEAIGGPGYVWICQEQAPVASNIDMHLRMVLEKWTLRRILQAANNAGEAAIKVGASPSAIIDTLRGQLDSTQSAAGSKSMTGKELTLGWLQALEERQEAQRGGREFTGIPSLTSLKGNKKPQ